MRGGIVLDHRARHGAFSRRDLHVMNGVAAQVSTALERVELLRRVEEEAEARGRLSRFLAPELVAQLVRGSLAVERGGREARVGVLYCDIRGFTPLTHQLGPHGTLTMLNAYFDALVPVVLAHGGMVDKFVGDELMAVWGVSGGAEEPLHQALACGIAIQGEVAALARARASRGEAVFGCGVGVSAGPAIVGLLGSRDRLQYTVVGDTVNLGARLCGLAEAGEVVTTADALDGWAGPAFGAPVPTRVKGVGGPVAVRRWSDAGSTGHDRSDYKLVPDIT